MGFAPSAGFEPAMFRLENGLLFHQDEGMVKAQEAWSRGPESNRRSFRLQRKPLPLGYLDIGAGEGN